MKLVTAFLRSRPSAAPSFSSGKYWDERYAHGGNSGPGSYGHLARFKADMLNAFVREHAVASVIEFGCGDGNQLALAQYPRYAGYDISAAALALCRDRFAGDSTKEFFLAADYDQRQADLALSLDVIFHLTEDDVYEAYMRTLFAASRRYVAVYSSDRDEPASPGSIHVRHRAFTRWVDAQSGSPWTLVRKVSNAYPYDGDYHATSFSDFYFYEKR